MHYDVRRPFPSAPEALLAQRAETDRAPAAGHKVPKVLIIEDDPLNRKLFQDLLRANGYDICCASDGIAGLAACEAFAPDLILLDVQLPGLGGAEVAATISSAPHAPKIIAISAFAGAAEAARLREAGCVDCLPKPIAIAEFQVRIDRALAEVN